MDSKEVRGLMEAYSEVYASPEEIDEAITSEKGKAKAAEMIAARTTASGRAKSGKGANVAQIKHIGRSEREGLRGTPMTPTMAKNPAKSRTFSGTGNKAARRAGTYQEGFDIYDVILSHLIDEGYAETVESAEAIMVNMSEEWRESIVEEKKPYPEAKVARKREAVKKKEDIAAYQRRDNDANTLYKRGVALAFKKKMSEIGRG